MIRRKKKGRREQEQCTHAHTHTHTHAQKLSNILQTNESSKVTSFKGKVSCITGMEVALWTRGSAAAPPYCRLSFLPLRSLHPALPSHFSIIQRTLVHNSQGLSSFYYHGVPTTSPSILIIQSDAQSKGALKSEGVRVG